MIKDPQFVLDLFRKSIIPTGVLIVILDLIKSVGKTLLHYWNFFMYGQSAYAPDHWYTWPFIILFSIAVPLIFWRFPKIQNGAEEALLTMGKGLVGLSSAFTVHRIVTCPQGVVAYRAAPSFPNDLLAIDQKIKDILAANPDANLHELAPSLAIIIDSVQLAPRAPKESPRAPDPPQPPTHDNIIGDKE